MVQLQPEGESGDKKEKEQQSGHGSNPSPAELLPPVANMSHYERKLPRGVRGQVLAFSATFCLHSLAQDNVLISTHSGEWGS
jgi:hypothetical protein